MGTLEFDKHTTLSCAAACSFCAFPRLSLYFCSSGFSGFVLWGFLDGSEPASIVEIVAAEGVAMSAIMAVRCAETQAPGSQVIASSRGEQVG